MESTEHQESTNPALLIANVIERMDLECDETLEFLKETISGAYDLNSEREEEIFMMGFIEAMEHFKKILESVR